jgi:hypothetical protein
LPGALGLRNFLENQVVSDEEEAEKAAISEARQEMAPLALKNHNC